MQTDTGQRYALKVVDKHLVLRNNYTEYIKTERTLLDRLDSPWVVNLHFTFQDTHSLYFVLELCPNGKFNPSSKHTVSLKVALVESAAQGLRCLQGNCMTSCSGEASFPWSMQPSMQQRLC